MEPDIQIKDQPNNKLSLLFKCVLFESQFSRSSLYLKNFCLNGKLDDFSINAGTRSLEPPLLPVNDVDTSFHPALNPNFNMAKLYAASIFPIPRQLEECTSFSKMLPVRHEMLAVRCVRAS